MSTTLYFVGNLKMLKRLCHYTAQKFLTSLQVYATNVVQSYSFVGENTPESLTVYCTILGVIEAPNPY